MPRASNTDGYHMGRILSGLCSLLSTFRCLVFPTVHFHEKTLQQSPHTVHCSEHSPQQPPRAMDPSRSDSCLSPPPSPHSSTHSSAPTVFPSSALVEELNLIQIFKELREGNPYDYEIRKLKPNPSLQSASLFSSISSRDKAKLLNYLDSPPSAASPLHHALKRAVGSLCGLAIADSIGHNFEFLPVQDHVTSAQSSSYLEYPSPKPGGRLHGSLNQFRLKPGQWTDDASMALCQADSLLTCGGFNGSHTRCYYWNWWNNSVNNAFRYDETRSNSCGLGGNISQSLGDISHRIETSSSTVSASSTSPSSSRGGGSFVIPHRYGSFNEDSGNGSLMRLAPIPIRYHHCSSRRARDVAYRSSLTTHPGSIAAEACAVVTYLIRECLSLSTPLETTAVSATSPLSSALKSSFFSSFLSSAHSSSSSLSTSPPPSPATATVPTAGLAALTSDSVMPLTPVQEFLTRVLEEYIQLRDEEEEEEQRAADTDTDTETKSDQRSGWKSLRRLLIGRDNPPTERCWNWKDESLDFQSTLEARGRRCRAIASSYLRSLSLTFPIDTMGTRSLQLISVPIV
jgi:ADP-ribosylglycohydrolase